MIDNFDKIKTHLSNYGYYVTHNNENLLITRKHAKSKALAFLPIGLGIIVLITSVFWEGLSIFEYLAFGLLGLGLAIVPLRNLLHSTIKSILIDRQKAVVSLTRSNGRKEDVQFGEIGNLQVIEEERAAGTDPFSDSNTEYTRMITMRLKNNSDRTLMSFSSRDSHQLAFCEDVVKMLDNFSNPLE